MLSLFGCAKEDNYKADFRNERLSLVSVVGVSNLEIFGRWTDSNTVVLETPSPLPTSFNLIIDTLGCYKSVNGTELFVTVSGETLSATVDDQPQNIVLNFKNVKKGTRVIVLNIPGAKRPIDIEGLPDTRVLGLRLSTISIIKN